jgi:serine/threonine-protein kinase
VAVALEPGAVIAGRYRLDRLIGEGGMGVVWAATDTDKNRPVCIKHLRADAAGDEETRKRFLREAQATSAIAHPNIVAIHDFVKTSDGLPAIVMDLLDGEPLSDRLSRERKLSVADTASILLPVVSAVGTAHSLGIVHRDLKPDNIFLCSDGASVKVLDFGIAKLTSPPADANASSVITGTWALLGTPYYMSPEQIIGEKDIDHRTDIWALGVILYECLAGVRPAEAKTPGKIFELILLKGITPLKTAAPTVPRDLASLVGRMLARERVDRPADLREVLDVLARHTPTRAPAFDPPVEPRTSLPSVPPPAKLDPTKAPGAGFEPESASDPNAITAPEMRISTLPGPPETLPAPTIKAGPASLGQDQRETLDPPSRRPSQPGAAAADADAAAAKAAAAAAFVNAAIAAAAGNKTAPLGNKTAASSAANAGAASTAAVSTAAAAKAPPSPAAAAFPAAAAAKASPSPAATPSPAAADEPPSRRAVLAVILVALAAGAGAGTWMLANRLLGNGGPPARASSPAGGSAATSPSGAADASGCPPEMALIQGGAFLMGASDGKDDEQPVHRVEVRSFCLDKREVTASAYAACVGEGACSPAAATVQRSGAEGDVKQAESAACVGSRDDRKSSPMNCVDFAQAEAFCKSRKKRLPTEEEWEFAAKGTAQAGVLDLAGGVGEWTSSAFCAYPSHACSNPARVVRGSAGGAVRGASARATSRLQSAPSQRFMDIGFRCASQPR